jgi:hypothetical protein
MRLYSTVCYGFLVVFLCNTEKPAVVSDFCDQVRGEVTKFRSLSDAEVAALQRPRKEAILSLRRKFEKLCK